MESIIRYSKSRRPPSPQRCAAQTPLRLQRLKRRKTDGQITPRRAGAHDSENAFHEHPIAAPGRTTLVGTAEGFAVLLNLALSRARLESGWKAGCRFVENYLPLMGIFLGVTNGARPEFQNGSLPDAKSPNRMALRWSALEKLVGRGRPTTHSQQKRRKPAICGRSSMVERQLPKLHTRVRFPSPAPAHLTSK